MKNFIFKSPQDFHKIVFNKLDMILAEQRHARLDLGNIIRLVSVLINESKLQKQVDDFYENEPVPEDTHTD